MLKNSNVVLFVTLKSWSGRKLLDPTTYTDCSASNLVTETIFLKYLTIKTSLPFTLIWQLLPQLAQHKTRDSHTYPPGKLSQLLLLCSGRQKTSCLRTIIDTDHEIAWNQWFQLKSVLTFFYGATTPSESVFPHYRGYTITLRHTTLGRTPLEEWSARCTGLYLTTHNSHKRQTPIRPGGDSNPQSQQASGHRPTPRDHAAILISWVNNTEIDYATNLFERQNFQFLNVSFKNTEKYGYLEKGN